MTRVKTVFDKITLKTTPVRPEYDEVTDVTILKSEVQSDLTPEVFKELSEQLQKSEVNLSGKAAVLPGTLANNGYIIF